MSYRVWQYGAVKVGLDEVGHGLAVIGHCMDKVRSGSYGATWINMER